MIGYELYPDSTSGKYPKRFSFDQSLYLAFSEEQLVCLLSQLTLINSISQGMNQKYSDDSAVVGCFGNEQEAEYRELVANFVAW